MIWLPRINSSKNKRKEFEESHGDQKAVEKSEDGKRAEDSYRGLLPPKVPAVRRKPAPLSADRGHAVD